MSKSVSQTAILKNRSVLNRLFIRSLLVLFIGAAVVVFLNGVSAQDPARATPLSPTSFRINERITYNVSFGRAANAAYAEIYAVSRGKIGERDAVELRSKVKTLDLTSAAFYLFDETRTTFAAADTGLPLYIVRTTTDTGAPKETVENYLQAPNPNFDLLSLIYQARNASGSGTFSLQEDDKVYSVIFAPGVSEKVKTDAGEFDTTVSGVQSDYFTQHGILDLRINFSVDEDRLPVLIRFKTAKGEFRASMASVQMIEPEKEPIPLATPTPATRPTPKPVATPTPVVVNQALLPELSFVLGETLEYAVSANGQPVGNITLQAKERKPSGIAQDSLLLQASVTGATGQGMSLFKAGDTVKALVNPDTLSPQQLEIKFTGSLGVFNQTAMFDQRTGAVMTANGARIEAPVGTHNLLSLFYAIRSFNLKPSKDPKNPVNDTRVAVFWSDRPYIFTLRPSDANLITLQGEKVSAQLVSIITGNQQLDQLALKIWLGNGQDRIPLRFTAGMYQADLVSHTVIPPK
jgi:Protein of unknown function (DUF3108)